MFGLKADWSLEVFERYFTLDEIVEEIDQVTKQDVLDAAQDLFDKDHFSSVILTPAA